MGINRLLNKLPCDLLAYQRTQSHWSGIKIAAAFPIFAICLQLAVSKTGSGGRGSDSLIKGCHVVRAMRGERHPGKKLAHLDVTDRR